MGYYLYLRDLKPGNVLLDDKDLAVLMDFGSAELARVVVKNSREAQALQVCIDGGAMDGYKLVLWRFANFCQRSLQSLLLALQVVSMSTVELCRAIFV